MSSLDEHIAELYGLPLEQFVPARTALARSLGGADAKRVKTLTKPTVVPWAVNQVFWHAPMIYNTLLAKGTALRSAQIAALEGRKSDAPAAQQAHRRAIATAVTRASELARAAGANPGSDDLSRMFEAVSLAETPAEPHGQFTRAIAPAGFEALAGVTVKALPRPVAGHDAPERAKSESAPADDGKKKSAAQLAREKLEAQKAAAAERLREAAVAKAERQLQRAQAAEADARAAWQKAKQEMDEAERVLRALE